MDKRQILKPVKKPQEVVKPLPAEPKEMNEEIFALPVRVGAPMVSLPSDLPGTRPKYATAVGLIRYADKLMRNESTSLADSLNWSGRTTGRVKKWLSEIF